MKLALLAIVALVLPSCEHFRNKDVAEGRAPKGHYIDDEGKVRPLWNVNYGRDYHGTNGYSKWQNDKVYIHGYELPQKAIIINATSY